MPRNNVYCDQCKKDIEEDKLAYFSDPEKDLDFCSENCYLEWKNFKEKKQQEEWENRGFNYNDTKKWLDSGLTMDDYDYVQWLRDIKKIDVDWVLNNFAENKKLKERYKRYGVCQECQVELGISLGPSFGGFCSQTCHAQYRRKNFKNWTSDNQGIDEFIQESQIIPTDSRGVLEWIPYEKFSNIEYLTEGGFSKIYKAKWGKEDVVLKILKNSQNMTKDLLKETAYYKSLNKDYKGRFIVPCYGISKEPLNNNYVMVMGYMEFGNLRQNLQSNFRNSILMGKVRNLHDIARALSSIHQEKLIHCDFHPGNILNISHITDLGLCRPVNEVETEKVYGILPYVAPEVLLGKGYTQESDIYSFGIMAYEYLANAYPYYVELKNSYPDLQSNEDTAKRFALDVTSNKLRPKIDELKIPQLLKDLIKSCWDVNLKRRPSANELNYNLYRWWNDMRFKKNTPFYHQYQEIEQEYNQFSQTTPYQIHSTAVTHSQLINTQQIAQLFQESKIKALAQELKHIEILIDQSLTDEQRELISDFIQTKKLNIQDEADEATEDQAWDLEDKLKDQGLSNENIEKIIEYCERFVDAEKELGNASLANVSSENQSQQDHLEQKQEATMEIPTKK